MRKKEAHDLFRKLLVGKRIDRKISTKFIESLKSPNLCDMPKLCYDFLEDRNCGDNLIFCFALNYVYHTEGEAKTYLAYYQNQTIHNGEPYIDSYATAYDEGGYLKFSFPEKSILAGYTGPYISSSERAAFEIAKIQRGQMMYLIDPFGENGMRKFPVVDIYDKQISNP